MQVTTKNITRQEFAARLNAAREAKGWSQSDLGRRSGIERDSVSCYCRGRSFPRPDNLDKLALALGCKPSDLCPNAVIPKSSRFYALGTLDGDHTHKLLTVNRMRIPNDTAKKIFDLLLLVEGEAASVAAINAAIA